MIVIEVENIKATKIETENTLVVLVMDVFKV
jgi:hypothetical protein